MNTAAIYVRVSTDAQADNDRVSLPDQIRRCLDRALADGYEVAKPHIFSDTVSGTKDETDRPGFGALMASARARSFERVYVLALDRLSRDLIVGVRTLEEFEKLGLGFVSLQEAGVENPLVRNLLLTLASEERKKIVARTMNGKRIKRARGQFVSGTVPYGYRRADGLTLEPCPEEAPVLRRIYEDMIAGDGRVTIARRLNRERVPPPFAWVRVPGRTKVTRLRMNEVGGWAGLEQWLVKNGAKVVRPPRWSEGVVSKLIAKPINYGVLEGDEDVGLEAVTLIIRPAPVVSEATFRKALAATAGRNMKGARPRSPKLLTGLIRCGADHCGRALSYHVSANESEATLSSKRRYLCGGRRSGSGCTNASVAMAAADIVVLEQVIAYLTSKLSGRNFYEFLVAHDRQTVAALAEQLASVESERNAKEVERKGLLDTIHRLAGLGLGEADVEDLATRVKALTPVIEKLRRQAETLHTDIGRSQATFAANTEEALEASRHAEDVIASLSHSSPEDDPLSLLPDARLLLRRVVRKVTLLDVAGGPRERLVVELDESDEALVDVVRMVGEHALAAHRRIAALEAVRQHDGDIDPELLAKLEAVVNTSTSSWCTTVQRSDAHRQPSTGPSAVGLAGSSSASAPCASARMVSSRMTSSFSHKADRADTASRMMARRTSSCVMPPLHHDRAKGTCAWADLPATGFQASFPDLRQPPSPRRGHRATG